MGKSQQSPHSKCLCRKIFSSPCPICKLAATASSDQEKNKPALAEITPSITKVLVAEPTHVKANPKFEEKQKSKLEAQLTKSNRTASLVYNDAFSDYINRAKLRIRAMSTVGMEKNAPGTDETDEAEKEENREDTFSNYISRAKLKIRKSSSMGSRKFISFKRD